MGNLKKRKTDQEKFLGACKSKSISEAKKCMLLHDVDVNAPGKDGWPALHIAVKRKRYGLTEILLDEGKANVQVKNQDGNTPLGIAIAERLPKMIQILLTHEAGLTNLNPLGQSALWIILNEQCKEKELSNFVAGRKTKNLRDIDQIMDIISDHAVKLKNRKQKNYYQIICSIIKDDTKTAKRLVKLCKDVNFTDSGAESPLEFAVLLGRLQIVEILLNSGADPNLDPSLNRRSVLINAISKKNLKMVELLLKFKADVNFVVPIKFACSHWDYHAENRWTPLYYASKLCDDPIISLQIIRQLLDHGADVNGTSIDEGVEGRTALHELCTEDFLDGVKLLASYSPNFNSADGDKNTPLHEAADFLEVTKFLIDHGAEVNAANHVRETPLHRACENGCRRTIEILIERGAKLNATNKRGKTILHYAVNNYDPMTLAYVADLTVSSGILNVNARDANGYTPLHETMGASEDCEMFVELLKRGADPNIKSKYNHCPVHDHDFPFEMEEEECPVSHFVKRLEMIGCQVNDDFIDHKEASKEEALIFEQELALLKEKMIVCCPRRTLFDVLFMDRSILMRCSENENLEVAFVECEGDFENKYPNFGGLLNTQIYRGRNRKKLIAPAQNNLDRVLGRPIPHICSDLVLKYLNDAQLKTFGDRKFK